MQVFLALMTVVFGCTLAESDPAPDWQIVDAGLYYQTNSSDEESVESGNEGLLIVHFQVGNDKENPWKSGTVCDDSFTSHAANLTCQYLGYSHVQMWGSSSRSNRYISETLLDKYNIHTLIDEVQCAETDREIMDCSAKVLEGHDCSRSEDIWLHCAGTQYMITNAGLAHYDNRTGGLKYSNEGVVIVQIEDINSKGSEPLVGTVCDDYFDDLAANLSCQGLGFKYAEAWGSEPWNYVPRHVFEELKTPILVDDVQCDEWASTIMECEAKIGPDDQCDRSENVWLRCNSRADDDDDDDDDEEEGGRGILDFKGGKATLTLNKFHRKWRF